MKNLAILLSGSGTNTERIIRYFKDSKEINIVVAISNRADAYGLVRARNLDIDTLVMPKADFNEDDKVMDVMRKYKIDWVICAGFLLMVPSFLIKAYPKHILNIHPALLPKYGGKGMYGMKVHNAVVAAGEKESGITIHYVSEVCDGGEIIFQARCSLLPTDTPEMVATKIHPLEYEYFPKIIERVVLADKE
jgi:phosphoribosylglycinamide formyltransferase 1